MSNKKPQQKKMSEGTQALIVCLVAVAIMIIALVIVMIATINEESQSGAASTGNGTTAITEAGTTSPGTAVNMTDVKAEIDAYAVSDFEEVTEKTEYVKITVKDKGDIVLRLRSDIAPLTVKNFQKLVNEDFYNDLIFHRVIQNFMIQGGSGESANKTASQVKGEFKNNGIGNNLKHIRGVISMARVGGYPNSASSQFFICDADSSHLDGDYAAFGYVLAGMSVVDAIAAVECGANDKPLTDVVIESVCFVKPVETSADTAIDTTIETTIDTTIETTANTQA